MINQQKIKKLATIAADNNEVPKDIYEYALKHMGKQELKDFLKYYKNALDKKRLYVTSPKEITGEQMKIIKELYNDKDIIVTVEKDLGAGLKIKENDTIIDFSFKKYINDTIEKLKN